MDKKMINFTVGPVQMSKKIRDIGQREIPYFRTEEFSKIMKENEKMICSLAEADDKSKALFLTGSGTSGMEATILNCFSKEDKVLIINGGSFGQRFVDICKVLDIPFYEIKLNYGEILTEQELEKYSDKRISGLLVNAHETSTGILYDMKMISKFCKKNNIFFVVDSISSFIADELSFLNLGIDVMIIGSQKALALPPGLAILILSKKAITRIKNNKVNSLYFDLKIALKDNQNGQTPFTPAVSILLQLHERLKDILEEGIEVERAKIKELKLDFINRIKNLPLKIFSKNASNAMTAIETKNVSAYSIFLVLKDEYNIWVCPNGGELKEKIFRVGHIGQLSISDNDKLIEALNDINKRGLL